MRSELIPYTGPWGNAEAAHLLRRTSFGFNNKQLKEFTALGLEESINQIFKPTAAPKPPVNYYFENDPYTPMGQTWVDKPYKQVNGAGTARFRSLAGWTFSLLLDNSSIIEKLTLFWHNHFVTADIGDKRFVYRYISTLRAHALGNFKTLTTLMTVDPAMLRYLNGNDNKKGSPNENYAREVLELFTVGKGNLAGPGDYTTFTEDDVVEMAKALTGWKDEGHNKETVEFGSRFVPGNHDTSAKQLSHRFGNKTIANNDDLEYIDLIDIIFESDEVALHISRKLYRWFVHSDITEKIEGSVIQPMANSIRENNYEIGPTLRALLSSSHFFASSIRGCVIKSPMDFTLSLYNQFNVKIPDEDLEKQYAIWFDGYDEVRDMQMTYYEPPDVAGWKSYYQEPVFYRSWINSVTLIQRQKLISKLLGNGIVVQGVRIKVDVIQFISELPNVLDINEMLRHASMILFPKPLSESQILAFKEILIPGLPDFEWTIEFQSYLNDPDNEALRNAVEAKLKNLFLAMTSMPEYHMS